MYKCIIIFKRSATLAVALFIVAALAVAAAAPNVRTVSGAATPVVNGVETNGGYRQRTIRTPIGLHPSASPRQ